ncbi:hypothetical protein JOC86_003595 [Bacillus pakistanensis]|uniref:DUF4166 domain-containing protein n=1 Tax=Rossellomorea pakistanensis TaxID=992288 RepID=A0ABS2NGU8_9BACI|nr:DUF4166 domain-containing protein [Bacillus pakistanensis]MBM7587043.1 hypothetical protein [Bacillus pakistanensis]
MSVYKKVLGEQFNRLHPMLQKRYELKEDFKGSGLMRMIQGGPKWLYPMYLIGVKWKLLFPEEGKDVPFTIVNSTITGINGEEQVHWERIFYFKNRKRYFNALMSYDSKHNMVKDYLGEPHIVYSDLSFQITPQGYLKIESKSQRLVLGKIEVPLPRLFQGIARVTEKYVEARNVYYIKVEVKNPFIGVVFCYKGEFTEDE